jgi:hypothetical protein
VIFADFQTREFPKITKDLQIILDFGDFDKKHFNRMFSFVNFHQQPSTEYIPEQCQTFSENK